MLASVICRLPPADEPVRFTDVTAAAGHQVHPQLPDAPARSGSPRPWAPAAPSSMSMATAGSTSCSSTARTWTPRGRRTTAALYRNNHNGTFTDVTRGSGLDVELYGFGVAVGDYDNDGRDDVYLTALGGDRLFHNEGAGKFRDVTADVRPDATRPSAASAAWLDYDRDGKLDLFVANYVQWDAAGTTSGARSTAPPNRTAPRSPTKARRRSSTTTSAAASSKMPPPGRLADPNGKALGVAVLDYNNDGWPDLFVANDTQPNKLYRNLQNGSFKEEGLAAGVAFGEDGVARGAMGVDAADYDRSGRQHLIVGNFSNQMLGLYHNEGNGLFVDEAPAVAGRPRQPAEPHLRPLLLRLRPRRLPRHLHRQRPHRGGDRARPAEDAVRRTAAAASAIPASGKFEPMPAFSQARSWRAARPMAISTATAISTSCSPPTTAPRCLYRNDGGNRNHWLQLRLTGTKSNRDGIGAVVRVTSAGGTQWQTVHSGSSYCSASDLALTFGLGKDTAAATIEIEWPSGTRQKLANVPANQRLEVQEK